MITRFGLEGYGVRRAGSFAGKTATAEPVSVTTAPGGVKKRRYALRKDDKTYFADDPRSLDKLLDVPEPVKPVIKKQEPKAKLTADLSEIKRIEAEVNAAVMKAREDEEFQDFMDFIRNL